MNYTLLSEVGQIETLSNDSNFIVVDDGKVKQIKSSLVSTGGAGPITENAVKYTEQTLTSDQMRQARNNIEAASTEDLNRVSQTFETNLGSLSDLQTTNKTNIVAAINEVKENSSTEIENVNYKEAYFTMPIKSITNHGYFFGYSIGIEQEIAIIVSINPTLVNSTVENFDREHDILLEELDSGSQVVSRNRAFTTKLNLNGCIEYLFGIAPASMGATFNIIGLSGKVDDTLLGSFSSGKAPEIPVDLVIDHKIENFKLASTVSNSEEYINSMLDNYNAYTVTSSESGEQVTVSSKKLAYSKFLANLILLSNAATEYFNSVHPQNNVKLDISASVEDFVNRAKKEYTEDSNYVAYNYITGNLYFNGVSNVTGSKLKCGLAFVVEDKTADDIVNKKLSFVFTDGLGDKHTVNALESSSYVTSVISARSMVMLYVPLDYRNLNRVISVYIKNNDTNAKSELLALRFKDYYKNYIISHSNSSVQNIILAVALDKCVCNLADVCHEILQN